MNTVTDAVMLTDEELALIREEAAAITDDWSERQLIEPTRKETDAKFVREILRLCAPTAPAQSCGDAEQSGQWVHCSPALIKAGVSCANTPRRACACDPENVGHDHFIAHITAPAQSCGDAEQAELELDRDSWRALAESAKRDLAKLAPTPQPDIAVAAGGAQEADVLEWLETEVTAISCRYHGDPSYDHDAYWMRDRVVKLIGEARNTFAARAKVGK